MNTTTAVTWKKRIITSITIVIIITTTTGNKIITMNIIIIIIIIIIINAINIPITMAIIIVVLVVEYYTKQKDRRLKSVFTRHYCYIFRVVLWLCLLQRQWDVEINFCMGHAQSNQHIIMNILVLLKPFAFVISIRLIYLTNTS